jgi:hypothetical protein
LEVAGSSPVGPATKAFHSRVEESPFLVALFFLSTRKLAFGIRIALIGLGIVFPIAVRVVVVIFVLLLIAEPGVALVTLFRYQAGRLHPGFFGFL